jgi:hypothetical protein
MAEDLTRRRFRRDLDQLMTQHPQLVDRHRLNQLTHELEAAEDPAMETPPPKRKGRPSKGMSQFQQVNIYMPPAMVAALDRRVDQEILRTGRKLSRADIIREAVVAYLATEPSQSTHAAASDNKRRPR